MLFLCTVKTGTQFITIILSEGIIVRDDYFKAWTNKACLDTARAKVSEKICFFLLFEFELTL